MMWHDIVRRSQFRDSSPCRYLGAGPLCRPRGILSTQHYNGTGRMKGQIAVGCIILTRSRWNPTPRPTGDRLTFPPFRHVPFRRRIYRLEATIFVYFFRARFRSPLVGFRTPNKCIQYVGLIQKSRSCCRTSTQPTLIYIHIRCGLWKGLWVDG